MHKYRYYILALFFVSTLLLFWPGMPMYDSNIQYHQAITAQYSDHHPPAMALVWRYLDQWHAGFGLMFLLQISLIYGAILILLRTADLLPLLNVNVVASILLVLPIYPQILIYAVVVLKDVQCAFSFLLFAASMAYYTIKDSKPILWLAVALLLLLVYGTAVKYQAKFAVIIFAMWFGFILHAGLPMWRKIALGVLIYALLLLAVFYLNNILVPWHNKSYAWQYVKLYDLAALSVAEGQDAIPTFNKSKYYSFAQLQARFSYPAIDSLAFKQDPLLITTKNRYEMQQLCAIWRTQVYQHPWLYLKHRLNNMRYMLLARPGFAQEAQDVPLSFINDLPVNTWQYAIVNVVVGSVYFLFMSHLPVIILGAFYMLFALWHWRKTKVAPVLFAFTATALLMIGILFFKSMAGTPRYTYFSIVLIHAAHIFAYAIYKRRVISTVFKFARS